MSPTQTSIVGAGLSGLVLGRCLLYRGISAVLFERDTAHTAITRHGYGITLHPWAYRPLLKFLNMDERSFRSRLAVDSAVGGVGRLGAPAHLEDDASFRANRQKFEQMLREGLDVRWGHELEDISQNDGANKLRFQGGHETQSSIVIGADGVHSRVRKCISPTTDFDILPFAVYNGKRRVPAEVFNEKFAAVMDGANVIEHRDGQTLLQITVNDKTTETVSLSYTYSRPVHQPDPLFDHDRPLSGAKDIPKQLFMEIAGLEKLESPFSEVFNAERMGHDRLLNWLMRSLLVPMPELNAAADRGVVWLGDAVHAGPILGGSGANAAIKDAVDLAELILERGTDNLTAFYEGKYETWREHVESSEAQLAEIHGKAKSNL